MSPKELNNISSSAEVVSDFLHKLEVPYLVMVGIPDTDEFIIINNLPTSQDSESLKSIEEFRSAMNQSFDGLRHKCTTSQTTPGDG